MDEEGRERRGGFRRGGFRGRSFAPKPVKEGDEIDLTIEAVGEKGDAVILRNRSEKIEM